MEDCEEPGLLLCVAREVLFKIAISKVEQNLVIRGLNFVEGLGTKVRFCSVCGNPWHFMGLNYLYIRVHFLVIAIYLKLFVSNNFTTYFSLPSF
jgi:hypothetical protein